MNPERVKNVIDSLLPWLLQYGLQVLGAIAILFVGRLFSKFAGRLTQRALVRANVDSSLHGFLSSLVAIAVQAFAVIAALAKFGIQTTSFVALLGAAGFAIGMALQGSLGNFASGVLLLILRPFQVGDWVEVAGQSGKVVDIGIFATTLSTSDNQKVIVPNGMVTGGVIKNVNGNSTRRVDLTIGIGYADDIEKAKALILEILKADSRVLQSPGAGVAVVELADSSVNLFVTAWVQTADRWSVKCDTIQKIKETFDANGLSFPYPQLDVHSFSETS